MKCVSPSKICTFYFQLKCSDLARTVPRLSKKGCEDCKHTKVSLCFYFPHSYQVHKHCTRLLGICVFIQSQHILKSYEVHFTYAKIEFIKTRELSHTEKHSWGQSLNLCPPETDSQILFPIAISPILFLAVTLPEFLLLLK